jgi:hypothetical protein
MKHQSKLDSEQQQQQAAAQQSQNQPALEFDTPEAMLRYDAAHTAVPPGIEQRLQQSAATVPPPARSWWRRFFKRSS